MPSGTPRQLKLEQFSPQQLDLLADAYDEIGARLRELRAVTRVALPRATDKTQRLAILRALDHREKLTIRITDAGNLSVRAVISPNPAGRKTYAVVVRRRVMPR